MTDRERFQEIERLYHLALEREPSQRAGFLKSVCGNDEGLLREVESLLAREEQADDFMEAPALEMAAGQGLANSDVPSLVGRRLGPYDIFGLLGVGGMGEVYRARDTRLDRTVAIKVLPPSLARDPERRKRFEREAKAVSGLNHAHICTLHDVGRQDEIDFLVMEYLEGETLAQRLKKGPLPLDQTLRYAVEIASALDHAHRHGVVHRDLKPGNIMLTKAGAKVLDFGLAKVHAAAMPNVTQPSTTLTEEGAILGTLQYMAPEQLEGKEADARSDIFAFGAVVYEMATGKKAFEGQSRASVIAAILEGEPPPISSLHSLTPPALDHVVRTCMAKDPEQRWQSAGDSARELRWIAEGSSQAGIPFPDSAHRRNRERLAWAVVSTIAVAAAIVLGIVSFRRPPSDVHPTRFIIQEPEGAALEHEQFGVGASAISPNGRILAFVASDAASKANPERVLWVRSLDSVAAQQLAGTEDAMYPFWSPDNRFIGFFAQGKLKKIDLAGRSVQTICDAPQGDRTSAWNREDVILFSNGPIVNRVPAAGGKPTPVTVLDPTLKETFHSWVQFLPDGHHFLYTALVNNDGHSEDNALYVGSLETGKGSGPGSTTRKRILSTDWKAAYAPAVNGGTGHLLFWRGNSLMAQPFDPKKLELKGEPVPVAEQKGNPEASRSRPFSISENGVLTYASSLPVAGNLQLVWYERTGKRIGTVGEPGLYSQPRLSPDQKKLVVVRQQDFTNSALWVFDLSRNTALRFTFHPGFHASPIWSPDGGRILFSSNWEGAFNLYEKAVSGAGGEEQILKGSPNAFSSDWSRDGRYIVYFEEGPKPKPDIWILPLEGDRKPLPFVKTEFVEWAGALSPDCRWVAYASDESKKMEVYVQTFTGTPGTAGRGGKWLVSTAGGTFPKWRRDGKELFYRGDDGKLMAVEIKSGATLEASAPSLLFVVPQESVDYDVTADGQRFIIPVPVEQAPHRPSITVVLNWQAELKR